MFHHTARYGEGLDVWWMMDDVRWMMDDGWCLRYEVRTESEAHRRSLHLLIAFLNLLWWVIAITRPLTTVTRPLSSVSGPLTTSKNRLEGFVKGIFRASCTMITIRYRLASPTSTIRQLSPPTTNPSPQVVAIHGVTAFVKGFSYDESS